LPKTLAKPALKTLGYLMQFTAVTDKETPQLWALYLEADPEAAVVRRYLPECRVYAAVQDGRVCAQACILPLSKDTCELKNLAVAAEERGRGLGMRLCEFLFHACRENGFKKMVAGTADISHSPVPFYERLGFKCTGVIKDFFIKNYSAPIYDGGEQCRDMVLLEKEL